MRHLCPRALLLALLAGSHGCDDEESQPLLDADAAPHDAAAPTDQGDPPDIPGALDAEPDVPPPTDAATADAATAAGPLTTTLCGPLVAQVCETVSACSCFDGDEPDAVRGPCTERLLERCLGSFGDPARVAELDQAVLRGELAVLTDVVQALAAGLGRALGPCDVPDGWSRVTAFRDVMELLGSPAERYALAQPVAVGDACDSSEWPPMACGGGEGLCLDDTCVAAAASGEPCDDNRPCRGALVCAGASCTPLGSAVQGDACVRSPLGHLLCGAGLTCEEDTCRPRPTTRPETCDGYDCPLGDRCVGGRCESAWDAPCAVARGAALGAGYVDDCGAAWSCLGADVPVCTALLGDGDPCSPTDRCAPGLFCDGFDPEAFRGACRTGCRERSDCPADRWCVQGGCSDQLPGNGEPCTEDWEASCEEGLWCVPGVQGATCRDSLPAAGEPCTRGAARCAEGLTCEDSTCQGPAEVGEACSPRPCADGLFCLPSQQGGGTVCGMVAPGPGEACDPAGRCAAELYCRRQEGARVCLETPAAEDEGCVTDASCEEGLWCDTSPFVNVCRDALPGVGARCDDHGRCAEGLDCIRTHGPYAECWTARALGESCP